MTHGSKVKSWLWNIRNIFIITKPSQENVEKRQISIFEANTREIKRKRNNKFCLSLFNWCFTIFKGVHFLKRIETDENDEMHSLEPSMSKAPRDLNLNPLYRSWFQVGNKGRDGERRFQESKNKSRGRKLIS